MLTAAFQNPKNKIYFFGTDATGRISHYVRYDVNRKRADDGYPRPISHWRNLPFDRIDAAFQDMRSGYTENVYFFYQNEYTKYNSTNQTIPPTNTRDRYPLSLAVWGLHQIGWERVDAVLQNKKGKVYFFRGEQYVRCNMESGHVDGGYPKSILEGWGIEGGIDAAFQNPKGTIYLFSHNVYFRYSPGRNRPDSGYPMAMSRGWGSTVAEL